MRENSVRSSSKLEEFMLNKVGSKVDGEEMVRWKYHLDLVKVVVVESIVLCKKYRSEIEMLKIEIMEVSKWSVMIKSRVW